MNAPSENLSLRWISPDLDECINIARRSFEAYLADPSASNSADKLASSVASTQAAANIFAEVDMLAAAGIAIEISALLEALQIGSCDNPRDCYQVIIGGFNQLFNYLALTRKLGGEEPAALLAVRSELRAVAGQPLDLPEEFFALTVPSAWSLPAPVASTVHDWAPLSSWLDALGEHIAAIDANPDLHRTELQLAFAYCETFSAEKWVSQDGGLIKDCCLAIKLLLRAACEDGQRVSAGVKRCISRTITAMSRAVKALLEGASTGNAQQLGEALEELLFFCSTTGNQASVVSATFAHYGIQGAIKKSASGVLLRLGTPDVETIDLVLAGLFEDIERLQNALRESVENGDGAEAFAAHENMVARLYYTAKLAGQDELYPVLDWIMQGFKNISESGVLEASSVEKIVEGVFELEALIEKMRSGSYRDKGELTVLEQVNAGLTTLTTALSLMANGNSVQDDNRFASTLEDFSRTIEELLAVTRFIATGLIATTLEAIQEFYTQSIAAPLQAGTTDGVQASCEQLSKALSMVQGSVESCRLSRHYVVDTGLYRACALLGVELVQAQAGQLDLIADKATGSAAISTVSDSNTGGWEVQALDAEIDDDIAEIFLEEAAEVLETLQEQLPLLAADDSREAAIGEVRRAYHTLKGSGRMAGAEHVGEAAWAIESMLNRVLDKSISLDAHRIAFIKEATAYMPVVVDNFQQRVLPYPPALESLVGRADILSNDASAEVALGESLDLLASLGTVDAPATDTTPDREATNMQAVEIAAAMAKAEEEAKAQAEEEAKAKAEEEAKAKAEEEAKAQAEEAAKAKAEQEAKAQAAEAAKAKAEEEAKAQAEEAAKAQAAEAAKAQAEEEAKAQAEEAAKAQAEEAAKAKAEQEAKAKAEEEASLAAAMVAVDSEREALREIFYEEAALQLALIEKYLENATQHSGIVPGEEVERACHTLLGGSRIAGVQPIADLMAPAEVLAGRMRRDNIANSNQEALFARAAAWLKSFLEGEPASADATIQLVDDFNIAMNSALADHAEAGTDHHNLLALSGLILDGRQFLRTWRAQSGVPSQFDIMVAELRSIADAASNLEPVQTLVEAMLALYRSSASIGLHYPAYSALTQAHLDLENMLDRIAAGQNPEVSTSVPEMRALVEQDEALLKKIAEGDKNIAGDAQLDTDDAMDAEIVEIFLEESQDLIEEVEASVLKWLSDQTEMSYLESLLRPLHTIKGGARMAGLEEVGNLCHEFESLLESASNEDVKINASFFKKVSNFLADLIAKFAAITNPGAEPTDATGKQQNEQEEDKRNSEVVRVAASLLEHLVNLAGETSISRSLIEEKTNDFARSIDDIDSTVERLKEQLRRLEIETEAQINFRKEKLEIEGQEDFDPLEMDRYSQLQQLSKSLVESASDLKDLKSTLKDKTRDIETLLLQQARVNTELQESLMRTRTVPLSRAIVPRLRRTIRQVSGELDKPVTFDIGSSDGELDRNVIERMVAPLEHVLRNAIDHGIESVSARAKAGKPETGSIRLDIHREGSDVVLRLSDDGKGIDVAAVRKKAIALGLMQEDDQLGDDEIKQFIMSAGFSTASKVTQISGRGVGMDVVQKEIHELGGTVELVSEQGVGTTFVFRLPFTVSMNRALLVGAGGETLAVPLDSIEGIVRVSPYELEEYYGDAAIDFMYAGQRYDFRYLGSLINGSEPQYSSDMVGALPVLLVRAGEKLVAFQVDRLLGSREIVVKSLGPQFARIEGVSGATVLGDGSVVMIADLASLVRNEDALDSAGREAIMPKAESRDCPLVMVVDDSVTVRKVTTRLLEREGFEVITAKDGLDAIEKLEEVTPDIMLCDIEMPRLDGFEVVTRVRNEPRLANMPIVMISSRTGDKHTERALSLGANDFLGKPYQDKNLLSTINCHLSVGTSDRAVNQ
ncbi:MAG: Hpt domain-containing protein [Pseudomonadales bacterium]